MPISPVATTSRQRTAPTIANSIAAAPPSAFAKRILIMPPTLFHKARHRGADRPRARTTAIDRQLGVAHEAHCVSDDLGAIGARVVAARILQGPMRDIDRTAHHLARATIELE